MTTEDNVIYHLPVKQKTFICSICYGRITDQYGNNALPVNHWRCCNECNDSIVIRARLNRLRRNEPVY